MIRPFLSLLFAVAFFAACTKKTAKDFIIARGQMPGLVKDNKNRLHLVYGASDSIMYVFSGDKGRSFSSPVLVGILPGLAASHTRGPQIAVSGNVLCITACSARGDIFSYCKTGAGKWLLSGKINDVDTIAKENLMALGADSGNAFAVWLDLRASSQNEIYGARSGDGGKTWSANKMIYASPDNSVCECCKPSVIVDKNNVFVLFRNSLSGNRDMYLVQSKDSGKNFGEAQKLGTGTWKLNGCPMDGGSFAIDKNGTINTIWRRQDKLYASTPGLPEKEIGNGRACSIEMVNEKIVYAWTEGEAIVVTKPNGKKISPGSGSQPIVKAIGDDRVICVWENEKQIHASVIEL